MVRNQRYAGRGHRLGNLVPSCRECNSSKGSKDWRQFAAKSGVALDRVERLEAYENLLTDVCDQDELEERYPDLMAAYSGLRASVNNMLKVADGIAAEIQRLKRERRSSVTELPTLP